MNSVLDSSASYTGQYNESEDGSMSKERKILKFRKGMYKHL